MPDGTDIHGYSLETFEDVRGQILHDARGYNYRLVLATIVVTIE